MGDRKAADKSELILPIKRKAETSKTLPACTPESALGIDRCASRVRGGAKISVTETMSSYLCSATSALGRRRRRRRRRYTFVFSFSGPLSPLLG